MPDHIQREVLTREKLALFHDFDCGESEDQPWVQAVNDWITGRSADDCAAIDIKNRRCKVFLYRNQSGELIGFGSLGKTKAEWPMPDGPRIPVAIIPWIGLHKRYHGEPNGNDAEGQRRDTVFGPNSRRPGLRGEELQSRSALPVCRSKEYRCYTPLLPKRIRQVQCST